MWERRAFLKAAGAAFVSSLTPVRAEALAASDLVFASSVQTMAGGYAAALLNEAGTVIAQVDLPDRGHDITYSVAAGRAVVFARQPGTFAVIFDPAGREAPMTLTAIEGRHLYGHGVFSKDGRLLFVTESDFEAARGVIGVYDATSGFGRIGELDTFGVGPHEVLLLGDGRTLAIANGGIETHPDYGRTELNLDTMEPSLAFVDAPTGDLIGKMTLPSSLHQLSIRHLAVDLRERVWFGCQYRGPKTDSPQLVGYATRDGDIRLIDLPWDGLRSLRNYVGSLAAGAGGELIAVSSPEGSTILAIDATTARPIADLALANGCGIAPDRVGFLASGGEGDLAGFAGSPVVATRLDLKFDNHLRLLRA